MNRFLQALVVFLILFFTLSCETKNSGEMELQKEPLKSEVETYDSLLAAELGADDYGMRSYVLAFLKSGPNRDMDSSEAVALQKAHLENIGKMASAGKLALAGPFLDGGELRGIYIFDVPTLEEAQALTATDPAVKAGRLVMELHPWYGSAGLKKVNEIHERIAKIKL